MTTREEAQILAASLEHVPAYLDEDRAILEDAAQLLRQWPEAREPQYLMDGARFKLNFNGKGNCTTFSNLAHDLQGRWVALVAAENDKHLAAPSQQPSPERNEWKEAVLDQLAAHAIDAPKDDPPAAILRRVIDMAVTIALDPAVSSDAQALIDRGAEQAVPQPQPLTDEQIDYLWDRFDQAPTLGYRYFVTKAIERAHGIGITAKGEQP